MRAMAFFILSSLNCNPVLKGLSKALYLSTASTVRVIEETSANVVMRADANEVPEIFIKYILTEGKPVSCNNHYGEDITNGHTS